MKTINDIKNKIDAILLKYKKIDIRCRKLNELSVKLESSNSAYFIGCTKSDIDLNINIYNAETGLCIENYRPIYI